MAFLSKKKQDTATPQNNTQQNQQGGGVPDLNQPQQAQNGTNGDDKKKKKSSQLQITKKQGILLMVVALILVVFLAYRFLISPLMSKMNENESTISTLQEQYDGLLSQSADYEANKKTYDAANNKFEAQTSRLFNLMDSDTADRTITPIIKDIGLTVDSVTITDLNAFFIQPDGTTATQSMKYYQALAYSDTPTEDPTEDEAATVAATTQDGQTYGEAQSQIEGQDASEASTEQPINTGEYYYSMTYSLEGTYAEITKLVQEITKDVALSISSLTFDSQDPEEGATDENGNAISGAKGLQDEKYTITAVIDVYMYDDPSTGTNDTEDETATGEDESGTITGSGGATVSEENNENNSDTAASN